MSIYGSARDRSSGVVALLFTDLVGSTGLIDRLGDDRAEDLRHDHFALLRQAVSEAGGQEVKNLGDGLMVVFSSVVDAASCAVAMQRAVADHNDQPDSAAGAPLHVRIGLHAGEPYQEEGDFFGGPVVVAQRLCDQANGGQILATEVVATLIGSRGGFRFKPVGRLSLILGAGGQRVEHHRAGSRRGFGSLRLPARTQGTTPLARPPCRRLGPRRVHRSTPAPRPARRHLPDHRAGADHPGLCPGRRPTQTQPPAAPPPKR